MNDNIGMFRYFCQRVLPAVYDDSLSYYEVLCNVTEKLNEVISADDSDALAIAELQEKVAELAATFETFAESGFEDYYEQLLKAWIDKNGEQIIKDMLIIGIFFGLTDDGYFCAYVPDSWSDIMFDTGAVYGSEEYGRLILRYDVAGGQGVINNT